MTQKQLAILRKHYALKNAKFDDLRTAYKTPSSNKCYIYENLKNHIYSRYDRTDIQKYGVYGKNSSFFTFGCVCYQGENCLSLYVTYKTAVRVEETPKQYFIDYYENHNGFLSYIGSDIISRTDEP